MERIDRERDACGIGFVADAEGRASREILSLALEALRRVRHRGAVAADAKSGDGAGVLLPIPDGVFHGFGVGALFLGDGDERDHEGVVELGLREEGLRVEGWREVPVDPSALGDLARATRPAIRQVLIGRHFAAALDHHGQIATHDWSGDRRGRPRDCLLRLPVKRAHAERA